MSKMIRKAAAGMMAAAVAVSPMTALAAQQSHASVRMSMEAPEGSESAEVIKGLLDGMVYDVYVEEGEDSVLENLVLTLNGSELLSMICSVDESGSLKLALPKLDDNVYVLDLSGLISSFAGQLSGQGLDLSGLPALPEISAEEYAAAFAPVGELVMEVLNNATTMEEKTVELPSLDASVDAQVYTVTLGAESARSLAKVGGELLASPEMGKVFAGWGEFVKGLQPLVDAGTLDLQGMSAEEAGDVLAQAGPVFGEQLTGMADQLADTITEMDANIVLSMAGSDATGPVLLKAAVVSGDAEVGSLAVEMMQQEDGTYRFALTVNAADQELGRLSGAMAPESGSLDLIVGGMQLGSLVWSDADGVTSVYVDAAGMMNLSVVATEGEDGDSAVITLGGLETLTEGELSSLTYMVTEEEGTDYTMEQIPAGNEIDLISLFSDDAKLDELAETWGENLGMILVNDPTLSQIFAAE
ncbi:MAG: hypothetical protein Q4B59_02705 [Lachnospiraceae bacterium]|nr:hypothetical protein [Lachnospiraceae bacterium]